ncbi:MAG TPA: SPOR domain-containing protein [Thermoanaerobaculia bacterium]|nr:SPOR domain-containing protein [Thermoanaerobaculia bacterium]
MEHGEPNEPSYYEVALTNRQVLAAFVVLLSCLLIAFFSGIWIGRGGAEGRPAPAASEVEAAAGEVPLEEFRFFSEDRKALPVPTPAPAPARPERIEPQPGQSLAEDVGAPEPVAASPAPVLPTATPRPTAAPPPTPAPPRPTVAPAAAPAGAFYVQVFSSGLEERAKRFQEEVGRLGHPAFISKVTRDGREIFRVRVGPFPTREEAQPVLERIRQRINREAIVTDSP